MRHEGYTPGPWTCEDGRSIKTPHGTFFLSYFTEKGTGITSFPNYAELDRNAHFIADAPRLAERVETLEALLSAAVDMDEQGGIGPKLHDEIRAILVETERE